MAREVPHHLQRGPLTCTSAEPEAGKRLLAASLDSLLEEAMHSAGDSAQQWSQDHAETALVKTDGAKHRRRNLRDS